MAVRVTDWSGEGSGMSARMANTRYSKQLGALLQVGVATSGQQGEAGEAGNLGASHHSSPRMPKDGMMGRPVRGTDSVESKL
jgi:hypothetical protein